MSLAAESTSPARLDVGIEGSVAEAMGPTIASLAKSAPKNHTVTIRGTVTYRSNPLTGDDFFLVQDSTGGIRVDVDVARKRYVLRDVTDTLSYIEAGSEVEIAGTVDTSALTTTILPANIRILGNRGLPAPIPEDTQRAIQGDHMLQRLQISGVVHSVTPNDSGLRIRVDTVIGAYFLAQIPNTENLQAPLLENARIRLTGVAVPIVNAQGRFIRPMILVSKESDVEITTRAPIDPFAVPKRDISDFSGFAPKAHDIHRVLVKGSVTYWEPGALLYLQDRNRSVRVVTDSFQSLKLGDVVEASGFIESIGVVGELRRAHIRKVASEPPPAPIATDNASPATFNSNQANEKLSPSENLRQHDGLLVRTSGRLLRTQHSANPDRLQLILETGKSLTTAVLRHPTNNSETRALEDIRIGSLVSVTGVATVEYNFPEPQEDFPSPAKLDLLLRSPTDVSLLELASWWTSARIAYALASIGILLLASLVWTLVLRHMVLQRCKRLEEGIRKHRDSELEFKAAQQERQRLASDLHDGIQQLIVGAAFRLEAAMAHLGEISATAQEQFTATRTALISAQTSLRNFLSGSSSIEENTSDFGALITHTFQSMAQWPRNAASVQTLGETFPLSRHVMGSLLLLIQEAVSNSFKHGNATQVEARLIYKDETLEIRIEDNGSGFNTETVPGKAHGHFGLESMRHRMRWLGGAVDIQSTHNKGTCVRIRLPRSRSKATRRLRSI